MQDTNFVVQTDKTILSSKSLFYKTENFIRQTKYISNIDFLLTKLSEIIILNLVLGLIASLPVMVVSVVLFISDRTPRIIEYLIALIAIITMLLLTIACNYLLYKLTKKKVKNKNYKACILATIIIFLLCSGIFFAFPVPIVNFWSIMFT